MKEMHGERGKERCPGFSPPPTLHSSTNAFCRLSLPGSQRAGSWEMYLLDIQSSEKWAGPVPHQHRLKIMVASDGGSGERFPGLEC